MRKSRRDYAKEARREPFQLDLEGSTEENPRFVTFRDPNTVDTETSFDLVEQPNPLKVLQALLSPEDWDLWWAEWKTAEIQETRALTDDVMAHYGAEPGKRAS